MSSDIDLDFDWIRDVVDDAYTMGVGATWVVSEFAKRGFVIVPSGAVPTPDDRAAVGRLVRMESARLAMRVASGKGSAEWGAANDEWFAANNAIQPGDIEAAQRVANGGE